MLSSLPSSELLPPSPSPLMRVCDICGDAGFDEMLAICSQCSEGAEHVYCMQTLLDTVPPDWVCEGCKMREKRMSGEKHLASSDVQGHLSRPTRSEKTDISTMCHTLSPKSDVNMSDPWNVKADAPSDVLRGRSSHLAAPEGGQSLNGQLNVGGFKLLSGTDSLKLPSVEPGSALKTSLSSVESGSLRCVGSLKNMLATSPRRILQKSRSLKSSDEHPSFLLPSRPKNLIRSSSGTARLSSIGDGFKMRKISNQLINAANVTHKVSDINPGNMVLDNKGGTKLGSSGKTENTKLKLAGLRSNNIANGTEKVKLVDVVDNKVNSTKDGNTDVLKNMRSTKSILGPVSVVCANVVPQTDLLKNMGSTKSILGPLPVVCANVLPQTVAVAKPPISQGDVPFKDGLVNSRNNTTSKAPETSECLGGNVVSSLGTPRCYRCKEMGHTLETCPGVRRQNLFKANETQVCFGRGKLLCNQPLVQVQSNHVRNMSGSEAHSSLKMVHTNSSKQLSKAPWSGGQDEKHRFPAQSVERQTGPACPAPVIASPPGTNSPWPENMTPWQFRPVDFCHPNQGRLSSGSQLHPGISLTSPPAQGMGMAVQPVLNGNLTSASPFSCSDHFTPEVRAIPDPEILWHGSIRVSSNTSDISYYHGMQAHCSDRADPKVCEATKMLPAQLQVEELQRGVQNNTWPRSFQECPPNSNEIGIFFFPVDMGSHDAFYKPLLDRMIVCDLALRIKLEFAQLLIFPSHLLPKAEQRWDDRMYLWGIFRTNKEKVASTTEEPTLGVIRESGTPHDGITGNDLGSPHGVGEVIDMDIDMEGGLDVGGVAKILEGGVSNLQVLNKEVNLQSPCLPPGLSPSQPPPPNLSQSQRDDVLKSSRKHELPVEHDICAEKAPFQSMHGQNGKISTQACAVATDGSLKDTSQTAGKFFCEDKLKELSQMPNVTQIDFKNHGCSRPLESQQCKEHSSSTQRDFFEQPEGRDCLSSREVRVLHSEGVNKEETNNHDFRESIKIEHSLLREMGNVRKGLDGRKGTISMKVKDEVDGDNKSKENRELLSRDVQKHGDAEHQTNSHHNQVPTCLSPSRISNSGASSGSLSGSPPCSSRRSELMGNHMFMKGRHEASKYHRQHVSPSSSQSGATESGQALSRSSGDHSQCVWNSSTQDKFCNEQETSESNRGTVIFPRIVTSCCSLIGDENISNGWQYSPDFVERVETASHDIAASMCQQALSCLPLFPTEESSTELDTKEFFRNSAVDQEGGWSDQRWPANQPILDWLERPCNSSKIGSDGDQSRESLSGQSGCVVLDSHPELTLSLPHYRKEGNRWIRIKDDSMSFCGDNVDLSLSLF